MAEAAEHCIGSFDHIKEVRVETEIANLLLCSLRSLLQEGFEALAVAPFICIDPEPLGLDQPVEGVVVGPRFADEGLKKECISWLLYVSSSADLPS